jgi:hypothetical protein
LRNKWQHITRALTYAYQALAMGTGVYSCASHHRSSSASDMTEFLRCELLPDQRMAVPTAHCANCSLRAHSAVSKNQICSHSGPHVSSQKRPGGVKSGLQHWSYEMGQGGGVECQPVHTLPVFTGVWSVLILRLTKHVCATSSLHEDAECCCVFDAVLLTGTW